ncbi:hypothetical protein TSUD_87000 [Trifolium subterraneum]|uniref:Dirigent protein n=1 Tax=Trifolium subterraneum TaxID=3900 RepID=A0A2Z6PKX3_TRISU|nr:hypothetical protein TSUD_87000 [Trifolium subterraneum]
MAHLETIASTMALILILTFTSTTSTRILGELETPEEPITDSAAVSPVSSTILPPLPSTATTTGGTDIPDQHHTLSFFMHDILGGSNPTARAVTGVVTNPALNAQVAFAKPNEGEELGSGLVGKAQGFYIASSVEGTSQVMAFTAKFEENGYEDSLSFFGVHRTTQVSQSQLAIIGGTGKYVNANGFAIIKTFPVNNGQQHNTDGLETLLHLTAYLSY